MKSYLLMHKETGNLVEGVKVLILESEDELKSKTVHSFGVPFLVQSVSQGHWIVSGPVPTFGGLWYFMPENAVSREWVVVGEV